MGKNHWSVEKNVKLLNIIQYVTVIDSLTILKIVIFLLPIRARIYLLFLTIKLKLSLKGNLLSTETSNYLILSTFYILFPLIFIPVLYFYDLYIIYFVLLLFKDILATSINVLPVKWFISENFTNLSIHFIYNTNESSPKIVPCGTPSSLRIRLNSRSLYIVFEFQNLNYF